MLLGLLEPVLTVPKTWLLTKHFCCILLTGWTKEKCITDNLFLMALLSMLPKLSSFSFRHCFCYSSRAYFAKESCHSFILTCWYAKLSRICLSQLLLNWKDCFQFLQSLPTAPQEQSRVRAPSNEALEPPYTYFFLACLFKTCLAFLRQSLSRILVLCCLIPLTIGGEDGTVYSRSEIQSKVSYGGGLGGRNAWGIGCGMLISWVHFYPELSIR